MSGLTPKDIPTEFYNPKQFFTLSGAAAAVWIFCLVIAAVFPQNSITPFAYRIIAIILSEIIAIIMVLRLKNRKIEIWFLSVFNGILIFIHASGWNVITTNNFFSDRVNKSEDVKPRNEARLFEIFHKQISWWDDNNLFMENRSLKIENDSLKKEIIQLNKTSPFTKIDTSALLTDSRKTIDSLMNELYKKNNLAGSQQKMKEQINSLQNEIIQLKALLQQKASDSPQVQKTNISQSFRFIQQQYEIKLKNCEKEKQELQSKLTLLNRALQKGG